MWSKQTRCLAGWGGHENFFSVLFFVLVCNISLKANGEDVGFCRESDLEGFWLPPKLLSWTQIQTVIHAIQPEEQEIQGLRTMQSTFHAGPSERVGTLYRVTLLSSFPGVTRANLSYIFQHTTVQRNLGEKVPQVIAHAPLLDEGPGNLVDYVWDPDRAALHLSELRTLEEEPYLNIRERRPEFIDRDVSFSYQFFTDGRETPFLAVHLSPEVNPPTLTAISDFTPSKV